MTLIQFKYAIACDQENSFSSAAKKMFTSTPNISKAIANLEGELGYSLFTRSSKGLEITHKGKLFIRHAHNILSELNFISILDVEMPCYKLRISTIPITYFFNAFKKLSIFYQEMDWVKFQYNSNSENIVDEILKGQSDLGIIVSPKGYFDVNFYLKQGITSLCISTLDVNLYFKNNHSIVKNYLESGIINYNELATCTLIDYIQDTFLLNYAFQVDPSLMIINHSKTIRIDDTHWKFKFLSDSNYFSIGTQIPNELMLEYEIMAIPISNASVNVYVLHLTNQPLNKPAEKYLEILREDLCSKCKI